MSGKKRIFSGIQPTGNLHLGNYLGAIKQWVNLQNDYESIFCIVDLHAITVPQNPEQLRQNSLNLLATYIASGIDVSANTIFVQSAVKEHAELAWILSCNTPLGWLNRMTQFKEKAGKAKDKACLGLYSYPVLMAADILLYDADVVPVGDDQKQHLELTREIAFSINHKYGKGHEEERNKASNRIFTIPEPLIMGNCARVMSLRDGTSKMSKSDTSDMSRINLSDSKDDIVKKFKKAKTDAIEGLSYDREQRPEISNLLDIFAELSSSSIADIITEYNGKGFASFKNDLAELAVTKLSPITEEYNRLITDRTYLQKIAAKGAEKARTIAEAKLTKVKEIIGLCG